MPFLCETTSKKFYAPLKLAQPVEKIKAKDELTIGCPSFKGQFQSLSNKEFQAHHPNSSSRFLPVNNIKITLYPKVKSIQEIAQDKDHQKLI